MQYKTLGKTNLHISEIGFGSWGLGGDEWRGSTVEEQTKSLDLACEKGINFFDTALVYGNGQSERLIGAAAKRHGRDKLIIASKIPPKNRQWPAACGAHIDEVFPPEHIRTCTEQSLRALGTDYIDLMQLHVWQDHWLEENAWKEELLRLQKEGKIRHIGMSINDHDPTSALLLAQDAICESVQVIYNIFDPSADDALFELCEQNNVGVIARVPFDEGALTGNINAESTFPEGDFRNIYFGKNRLDQVQERSNELTKLLGEEAKTLPELALRFCLSNPKLTTVIPGMRQSKHVAANVEVSDGRLLSPSLLQRLSRHRWAKNFYADLH